MRLLTNTVLFYVSTLFFVCLLSAACAAYYMGFSPHTSVLLAFTLIGLTGNRLADIAPYIFLTLLALFAVSRAAAMNQPKGQRDENANSPELLGTSTVRDE